MKKFHKRFLFFSIITGIAYLVLINLWEIFVPAPYKTNILYKVGDGLVSEKIEESRNFEEVDILFVGSSHAYMAFDPRPYAKEGYKVFNWGTTKQTHIQTGMVLDTYIERMNPKLVVYEVFPEIFALNGAESQIDFINAGEPFDNDIPNVFFQQEGIKIFNTFLVKQTRENIFNFEETDYKHREQFKGFTYVPGGYIETFEKSKEDFDEQFISWNPREDQMEAFEKNITFLKRHKIEYLLVITPYNFKYHQEDEIEFYLRKFGPLFNFNNLEIFIPQEDFLDFHHLNKFGAEKVNEVLMEIIRDMF